MPENRAAAKTGGKIAKRARLELEATTGRKVVTGENFLPPGSGAKMLRQAKAEYPPRAASASEPANRLFHTEVVIARPPKAGVAIQLSVRCFDAQAIYASIPSGRPATGLRLPPRALTPTRLVRHFEAHEIRHPAPHATSPE